MEGSIPISTTTAAAAAAAAAAATVGMPLVRANNM